jgi:hypothetical protein
MKRKFIALAACAIVVVASQTSRANPRPSLDDLQAVLMTVGVTETIEWAKTPRQIAIILDRNAVIASLRGREEAGVLNPVFTAGYINTHKNSLVIVTGLVHSAMEVDDAYRNTNINQSHVLVVMMLADDYGHQQQIPLFSFGFDRAMYNKIDWEHFDPANIPKVALNFQYSPWATMSAEPP